MRKLSLQEVHGVELDILSEIDRICTEQGLRYFLAYGTLLGAARHQGFIPWDDDMDIFMFRDDYEIFMTHFSEWHSEGRFQALWPANGSVVHFGKVVDTKTLVKETFMREKYCHGAYVDVFALDHVNPEEEVPFKMLERMALKRSLAITDPRYGSTLAIRIAKRVVCPFAQLMNANHIASRMDSVCKNLSPKTGYVADVLGHIGYSTYHVLKEEDFEPERVLFEGRYYMAPKNYELFLESEYGDWRTLPPESERIPHATEAYWLDEAK